jgi:hypothetical protein
MNSKYLLHISRLSLGLLTLLFILHSPLSVLAQVTTFTYQGRLLDTNNSPANGIYDFRFTVYVSENNPGSVAGPILLPATPVTNGLFSVTLDFGGSYPFPGFDRWLGIEVRTNGSGPFSALSPRQEVTPTPYAITAQNVLSGGLFGNPVNFNNPANTYCGDGGCLTNVNAVTFGGLTSANFWQLTGNTVSASSFLGTLNNFPLEIKVNNNHALRLAPATVPSMEGGYIQNSAHGLSAAAIVGGGASGSINEVLGNYGFVGAGYGAKAGMASAVVGGANNVASGQYSFTGSGLLNTNLADYSFIGGGQNNRIALGAVNSFVGAGFNNSASGTSSAIAGGGNNIADFNGAAIVGGSENHAGGDHSFIGGGQANVESAGYATIGGGSGNVVNALAGTIGGGWPNAIQLGANYSAIGGGQNNLIQTNSFYSAVGGGYANIIRPGANESTIGGGFGNSVGGVITNTSISGATVAGGLSNRADCAYSFVGGGRNNLVDDLVGFGSTPIPSPYAVIAGGEANLISNGADHSGIGGGSANQIQGGTQSVIAGGGNNSISGNWSTIPGGQYNVASGNYSFAAGQSAQTYNNGTFIWADSTAGIFNSTGDNQFCIRASGGIQVDSGTSMFFNTTTRQMLNLFGSSYGIGVQSLTEYFRSASDFSWFKGGVHNNGQNNPGGGTELMRLYGNGNLQVSGGFGNLSDRNAKEKFESVSPRDILEKVAALPVSRWSYKTDPETRHVGPMAQDFYAAFNVGTDDKHIGLGDEGGVALAAIQGLNEKVESENAQLRAENVELNARLERLEKLMLDKNSN